MLLRSLIVSLLLHLLFFWGLRGMALPLAPLSATAPKALEAVLSKAAVSEAPARSVQERLVPKDIKGRQERIIGPARENSRSEAPVLAANVPSTAEVHSVSSAKDGGEAAAPAAQTIAAVPTDVIDADGLRQYRLALAKEARRYKRYPALARERNWEGVVTVTISIPLPGALPLVSLGKSSGHEILDRQALEMIGQAVLAASLPESLRGKAVSVSLPVRYSLDE